MGTLRKVMMILVLAHADYQEIYDRVAEEISSLPIPVWALQLILMGGGVGEK